MQVTLKRRKRIHRRGVGVHDAIDVATGRHDLRMDERLQVALALPRQHTAVRIDENNLVVVDLDFCIEA